MHTSVNGITRREITFSAAPYRQSADTQWWLDRIPLVLG